eukprot:SAG11_NODE_91_length_17102_cov_37.671343_13_plen_115_part_00
MDMEGTETGSAALRPSTQLPAAVMPPAYAPATVKVSTGRCCVHCVCSRLVMAQYPLRATETRLRQALADTKRDLLQLDSHEWTQGNHDHFDTVVKVAMRRDVWYSVADGKGITR